MNRDLLPPEVQQLLAAGQSQDPERLNAFGLAIAAKRKEAVDARKASGIEDIWMECEEAYLGIDDENRGEFSGAKWAKPTTMDGPVRRVNSSDGVKSTAFVRLTSRYVDAGAAKLGELAPIDDKAFSLKPTLVPDLIKGKDDLRTLTDGGVPVMRPATPDDQPPAQPQPGMMTPPAAAPQPGAPAPQVPVTVADVAQHVLDQATDSAKKAETRIYDWMVEYGHAAEMRKVRFDGSRIGVGILKGPIPDISRSMSYSGGALQIEEKIVPVGRWIDPWNFYPDDACGEDIHAGGFTFEHDFLSRAKLIGLKRKPGYISTAIDKVIAEGPNKVLLEGGNPNDKESRKRFSIWYFYGEITLEELALTNPNEAQAVAESRTAIAQAKAGDGQEPAPIATSVFAIVTMVNDTVIRSVVNPLESGSFPYHVFNWRRRAGSWAGVGVAEQVRLPQRIINAATRAMLNNAGQSAGAITVIDRRGLDSTDGNWVMTPGKTLVTNSDFTMDDVSKAFAFFTVPNATDPLMKLVEYAFKLAEESSNIPLISQGQSGDTTPDTFGAAKLQDNNANQLLRDVGFAEADDITNPLVTQMYEWLLLDPDVPDDEKGDFKANVNAAIAMIERAIQDQTIAGMGSLIANPAFAVDPKKWFASYCRSKRLDPREFQYTEAEQEKMAQQPPPPPIPVQVAQINNASDEKIAAGHDQVALAKVQEQKDRGTEYVQAQTARDQANAAAKLKDTEAQVQIANLNYQESLANFANARGISTDQAKAQLAQTAMKLNVQKEISTDNLSLDLHKHVNPSPMPPVLTPPSEPAGKAAPGHAFEQ